MSSEGESTGGVSSLEPCSSNSNASDYSAAKCFYLISNMMKNIMVDGCDNEEIVTNNDFITKAINEIDICLTCVDKENLFSKNEEIDDINTGFIKVRQQTGHCSLPSLLPLYVASYTIDMYPIALSVHFLRLLQREVLLFHARLRGSYGTPPLCEGCIQLVSTDMYSLADNT